eukprot:1146510-Pelagomonas_calceolata.AAC.1
METGRGYRLQGEEGLQSKQLTASLLIRFTRFTIGIQPSARKLAAQPIGRIKLNEEKQICLTCAGIDREDMANRWNEGVKRFQLKQRNEG